MLFIRTSLLAVASMPVHVYSISLTYKLTEKFCSNVIFHIPLLVHKFFMVNWAVYSIYMNMYMYMYVASYFSTQTDEESVQLL